MKPGKHIGSSPRKFPTAALLLFFTTACSTGTQGPAPVGAHPAASTAQRGYTEADVRFMQRMIPHHAQALAMTALVPTRSRREDIRLLAERIEVSQKDEIAQMQRWLRVRGQVVSSADPHHGHHAGAGQHAAMPGMLTHEELTRLGAASGGEFERLFLEFMIRHHQGAQVMVAELFATPGAGQETEIFRFASDVDADQGIEIARMRRMLGTLAAPTRPR